MVCAHSLRDPAGHLKLGHFANLARLETMSNSVNESNTRRVSYLLVSDVEHPLGVSIMLEKFNSRNGILSIFLSIRSVHFWPVWEAHLCYKEEQNKDKKYRFTKQLKFILSGLRA